MMMPSLSVVHTSPFRRRNEAPALSSPTETKRAIGKAGNEPLEPDRHFHELAAEALGNAIDQCTRHQGLPDRGALRPVAVAEEIVDAHRQVVASTCNTSRSTGMTTKRRSAPKYRKMVRWFDEEGYSVDVAGLRSRYPDLMTLKDYLLAAGWNDR